MSRRLLVALAAVLAAGVSACATSGSSNSGAAATSTATSSAASTSAQCQAADAVRTSMSALQEVDVRQQGPDALSQAFAQVKSDLTALTDAARAQHAQAAEQVKTDAAAVQTALDQAKTDPSAQTVAAAGTAARTLAQDTQALLAAVGSSC